MKIKLQSDKWRVAGDRRKSAAREKRSCHSSPVTRHLERGIALVITLILLSVTLIMAVAFLAISRRDRGAVATSTDTTTARLAAEAALANAEAQIISSALATTNPYLYGLVVSTNYINTYGFVTGVASPTNVNYDYLSSGGKLNRDQFLQNVANLSYLPRVPVYVPTNSLGSNDFRFYLDLNRNGIFDDTGNELPNVDNFGVTNGITAGTGDPQWIGVLERPDAPHGPNNKFLSRYAFIALPAGNALDLNYMHNQSVSAALDPANDGYFRNQGVGSWEINLAAFLTDLNTNQWNPPTVVNPANNPYNYQQPGFKNTGTSFEDARALLAYRLNNNYNLLTPVGGANGLFTSLGFFPPFQNNIDYYGYGRLMTTLGGTNFFPTISVPWAGSDNTNHYFALTSDLFDTTKTTFGVAPAQVLIGNDFTGHLLSAGNGTSTYDRYTFYRMLAQLGTDSLPEEGKINVNYSNAVALFDTKGFLTNTAIIPNSQTNFRAWDPLQFFTIAADRMLRVYTTNWFQANPSNYYATYFGTVPPGYLDAGGLGVTNLQYFGQTNLIPAFGLTNIPVYVNGRFVYSSAVQRVLQLAANIYDATTNNTFALGANYPSVFRPLFTRFGNNLFITGYTNVNFVSGSGDARFSTPFDAVALAVSGGVNVPVNVYGVPWVIGAKKGFPNFNEFSMQDVVQVTRLLQVTRPNTNSLPNATNQMYLFGITNSLGFEFWNSYTNGYSNSVQIVVRDNLTMQMGLTNGSLFTIPFNANPVTFALNASTNVTVWPGRVFILPLVTNVMFLPNSQYDAASGQLQYVGNNPSPVFRPITPAFANLPQIVLQVTNRLQAFVLDGTGTHVIDYVHFAGPQSSRNLNSEIFNTNTLVLSLDQQYTNLVWSTAPAVTGNPLGIDTQIGISDGAIGLSQTYWKNPPQQVGTVQAEIDGFRHFLNPANASLYHTPSAYLPYTTNLAVQVPYAPSISAYEYTTWQANDPLVHYLQSDLKYVGADPQSGSGGVQTGVHKAAITTMNLPLLPDLGKVNARYQPWGVKPPTVGTGISQNNYDENPYNLAFKDPLATKSDNWDFPTNKMPTVGWLGRVHRGTPWQTVYLKASNLLTENNPVNPALGNVGTNTWAIWTGNSANPVDAANSAPVQDRLMFDVFTTAVNENATRGRLSVNQNHLAAWSAVLSGVVMLTNTTAFPQYFPITNRPVIMQPAGTAGTNSLLGQLVVAINNTRANTNLFPNQAFTHVGDILATPQLTELSPFLNTNNTVVGGEQLLTGISDEVYEWLPQQTMSLLSVSSEPRYVIYTYGQTLKPAPNGVVTSGAQFGMVTNYQVVAETGARAVVQFKTVVVTNFAVVPPQIRTNYNATIEQFNLLPPD